MSWHRKADRWLSLALPTQCAHTQFLLRSLESVGAVLSPPFEAFLSSSQEDALTDLLSSLSLQPTASVSADPSTDQSLALTQAPALQVDEAQRTLRLLEGVCARAGSAEMAEMGKVFERTRKWVAWVLVGAELGEEAEGEEEGKGEGEGTS